MAPNTPPNSFAVDIKSDVIAEDATPRKKQKLLAKASSSTAAASETPSSGRFKVLGHLVMAMKRFQASINPTYTYGKKVDAATGQPTGSTTVVAQPIAGRAYERSQSARVASVPNDRRSRTMSDNKSYGRTLSGLPNAPGKHHGQKGSLLFRPLPLPQTAQPVQPVQ